MEGLKRKRDQLHALRRDFDHRTFGVPGTQYHAVCGLAVPLVLERFLTHGNSRTQLLWIAALLLAGGFALRWCIVGAGAYDVTQMPEALYGLSTFGLTG